jgi:hypothetical protein
VPARTTPRPVVGGEQSSIASTLATPSDAFGSLGHDGAVLGIAGAATLLLAFPAELFNHTFEENYDEITAFLKRRLRRSRRVAAWTGKHLDAPKRPVGVVVLLLAGAYLGALLDPSFGINRRSLESCLGILLATGGSIALSAFVASTYRRRRQKSHVLSLRALPLGLVIGGACVLVSRLTSFEPGYLYGIVAGAVFVEELTEREEAHTAALTVLATLGAATVSWVLWDVVNRSATHAGADFALVVLDDLLAAVVAAGLTGTVISLLPLRFLPGGRIASWHRGAWGAVFVTAVFGLVSVLLWPNRDGHSGAAPVVTMALLFVGFGGISVGFWRFFERRKVAAERALDNPPLRRG